MHLLPRETMTSNKRSRAIASRKKLAIIGNYRILFDVQFAEKVNVCNCLYCNEVTNAYFRVLSQWHSAGIHAR